MVTIGTLLKSLRNKKNITLSYISSQTNIAPHLLKYLENDEYSKLPASTFTKGFITKYAEIVGLTPQKALAIFRRDFATNESGKIIPRGLAKPLDKNTFVTSRFFSYFGFAIFILLIFFYLLLQLKNYKKAPQIDIIRPKPNSVVRGPNISVKGYATADSTVKVNSAIADVFPTGEFQIAISLPEGEQILTIEAQNSNGKTTKLEIPVIVIDK